MISIKSEKEIEYMKIAGKINHECHELIKKSIRPGITTYELNKIADNFIREKKCRASFLGFSGFPASICTSVNQEVVHGIPSNKKVLKNGDVISIDIGVEYKGYHSDAARTYIVGEADKKVRDLVKYTESAFYKGASLIKEGVHLGDISAAIEEYAKSKNLGVIKELVGHGIGTNIHEEPDIPNFGRSKTGVILKAGMTLAIEPMLTLKSPKIWIEEDGWTVVTQDSSFAAHYENTILVTKEGYEIITGE